LDGALEHVLQKAACLAQLLLQAKALLELSACFFLRGLALADVPDETLPEPTGEDLRAHLDGDVATARVAETPLGDLTPALEEPFACCRELLHLLRWDEVTNAFSDDLCFAHAQQL